MINPEVLNEARVMIGEFIRSRRKELGITQIDLAKRCGLGLNTLKRIESGKFWIGLKQLFIICHELDMFFFLESKDGETNMAKLMRERWKRDGDNN